MTFSEYVISAAELFYGVLFDGTPQRVKDQQGFGTPTRALSFDFRRSLRPDEEFDMTVTVSDIRTRTYLLDITDRLQLQAAFERIAQLAALPVFWRLTFSRDFALLSEVREAILENLRQDISTAELRSSQRTYS